MLRISGLRVIICGWGLTSSIITILYGVLWNQSAVSSLDAEHLDNCNHLLLCPSLSWNSRRTQSKIPNPSLGIPIPFKNLKIQTYSKTDVFCLYNAELKKKEHKDVDVNEWMDYREDARKKSLKDMDWIWSKVHIETLHWIICNIAITRIVYKQANIVYNYK